MATQIDTEHFRRRLQDERQRVADAIEYLHKENPGSLEDETGELVSGSADNHPADTATETVNREVDYTLEANSGNVLREIDAALKRIEEGTFGSCSTCGRPIEPERLEHLPWTTLCAQDAHGGRG
jgi:RNA polymerase-binding transcription factor DksA